MSLTVKGPLLYAAENRLTLNRETVLILTIQQSKGWPLEARVPFGDQALRAAAYCARLPRGTHVTVDCEGATPRSDHGLAVLVLNGINRVDARSDSECFVVSGLLR